jgi:prolyl oligopeptidase
MARRAKNLKIYFQGLARGGPITPIVKTIDSCFQGDIAGDTLYLQTNWKAPKWRLLSVPLASPAQENWKETIPENETRLESFHLVGGKIIAQYSRNAASELKVFEADGKAAGEIVLPALGRCERNYRADGGLPKHFCPSNPSPSHRRFITSTFRNLRSPCGPSRRCRSNASQFEVKQIWYESKDKTRVPMFLFYKKGLKLDGSNPTRDDRLRRL